MSQKKLCKLMFVDDDEDVLQIAKYCLDSLPDVAVKYLSSGEETIKEAMTFQPDLILLDVMMPMMDGIATLKVLKIMPSTMNIPVIFFTAKVQKEELADYLNQGAIDIITKPFDPMTLADNIQKMWDKYNENVKR